MEILSTVRFAFRQIRKRWVLSLMAVLSLALCLGLNIAIFSVFNAVLLRPLPFDDPDAVVEVFNTYPDGGLDKGSSNIELYTVYKEEIEGLSGFGLFWGQSMVFGSGAGVERVGAMQASVDSLDMLGIAPALGAGFTTDHGVPGTDQVVLLTHGFWQSAFAGDPGAVGTEIELDGEVWEVIGVLPPSFRRFNAGSDIVIPFSWDPAEIDLTARHLNYAMLLARLAPGASLEEVQAQVNAVDAAYRADVPEMVPFLERTGHVSKVRPYHEERVKSSQGALYLLNFFALAVLVIGALNLANIRFAELAGRERELIIRRVMGGTRKQLLGQMLVESSVLVLLGSILGLVTAYLSLDLLRAGFEGLIVDAESITLDATVFGWAGLLIFTTIMLIGLSPMRRLNQLNYQTLLLESGRTTSASRGAGLRAGIGVLQTSLAVILLIATGLFVVSFWKTTQVEPGFETANVHTFRVSLPAVRYAEPEDRVAMVQRILASMRSLPGVESVAGASSIPIVTGMPYLTFMQHGDDPMAGGEQKAADNFRVTDGFFETLGIPLREGRAINVDDHDDNPVVFVIDATMSERFFDDKALQSRMTFGGQPEEDEPWPLVVGVVPQIVHRELTDLNQSPLVYRSYYQGPSQNISFLLRSPRSHVDLLTDIRATMADLDPQLPIYLTGELNELIENSINDRRAVTGLTVLFGLVAVLLAVAGIYGIHAYNVHMQHRTLAIRAALGATPKALWRRTVVRGMIPVAVGIAIGVIAAYLLTPQVEELIFAISVREPSILSTAVVAVLLASLAAISIPARIASRSNPARVLHED